MISARLSESNFFDIWIYAAAEGKMYAAFLLEYACFHAEKVVALAF